LKEVAMTNFIDLAIIGAGPYGLSIAAHLRSKKVHFRIFGSPMQNWHKHMPKGMFLKSEGFASSLYDPENSFPLSVYCRERGLPYEHIGRPVALETFASYGLEFQKRFVPQLDQSAVISVQRCQDDFTVTTENGETVRARWVIIATGISHASYLPPVFSNHDPEFVTHSSCHHDLSGFRGRRVSVVGGGASAADVAALLYDAGADVHLVSRRLGINFNEHHAEPRPIMERIRAPRSGLGIGWPSRLCTDAPLLFHCMPEEFRLRVVQQHLGPAPGWFIKEKLVGRVPILFGASIKEVKIRDRQVHLQYRGADGQDSELVTDHLIAATGYKVELQRLPFLDKSLRERIRAVSDTPIVNRYFESAVPGLYFVGLASANSFGPLTRFAFGAQFTARRLSKHIASRAHSTRAYRQLAK
jgi:cation diffusion facilitator CzcD-associated flavoprotein CzcO